MALCMQHLPQQANSALQPVSSSSMTHTSPRTESTERGRGDAAVSHRSDFRGLQQTNSPCSRLRDPFGTADAAAGVVPRYLARVQKATAVGCGSVRSGVNGAVIHVVTVNRYRPGGLEEAEKEGLVL